jgi:hypothetical protein
VCVCRIDPVRLVIGRLGCRVKVPPERRLPRIAGVRATTVAAVDTTIAGPRRVTIVARPGILRAIAAIRASKEERHHPGTLVRERHTVAASIAARLVIFRQIAPSLRGTKPVINVDKMDTLPGIVRIPGKSELSKSLGTGDPCLFLQ